MQQFAKKPTKTESPGHFKSEIPDSIETVHQAANTTILTK